MKRLLAPWPRWSCLNVAALEPGRSKRAHCLPKRRSLTTLACAHLGVKRRKSIHWQAVFQGSFETPRHILL